ncbi:hypothetical protein EVAR_90388_1 [Eumeta japonica]|uniref:Uncharacterized protein n=1 Tax=Eumeta variegata TaxID=151549 RepID=A0A4C1ZQ97_EUMVA|nr:hypothetical protein EVAR_90388_1 [Eumeta japonica]
MDEQSDKCLLYANDQVILELSACGLHAIDSGSPRAARRVAQRDRNAFRRSRLRECGTATTHTRHKPSRTWTPYGATQAVLRVCAAEHARRRAASRATPGPAAL